ncbi:hypothetical protein ACSW9Z_05040 [Clostridium perfringens]|uniref:Uncharacterized protein n=2 Tax=Clostridium perfringens TaxID=1502 RepID=A0A6G4ZFP4_CLOPF|nr:hypothetical protein [Clostridium perfringens]EIA17662.1 hypothetical protein HA1_04987 [Clostridium perfringens F262]EIF2086761.1 hypothetical protein [Clostridium perfringens]ELC8366967.1 hypothetical protein [Clostridium perfringens]MBO3343571.1 hypothetical protein [Clostridium perfringens]MBO3346644.1 hypothetical protein [Clostridium perfringens]
MEWIKIFKNYTDIKEKVLIYSFCDKEDKWFPELEHIFLHNTKSEMFIVIDLTKKISEISNFYNERYGQVCNKYEKLIEIIIKNWEKSILTYLNFEVEYEEKIEFLKYNITLVIICEKQKIENQQILESNKILKEEKSTNICRKIFIFNEKDSLLSELNYLPFYFDDIKHTDSDRVIALEDELDMIVKEATIFLENLDKSQNEENKC